MIKILLLISLAALLCGCNFRPQAPGWSMFKTPEGTVFGFSQPENPRDKSTAKYERSKDGTEKFETSVGAAQKDVAREAAAKLASLRPVMYVGIAVFLFGAASAFWPPLKIIIGSVTTSAVISLAGLALIVLPTIIIGNEVLLIGVAIGGAALYFFAHRHASVHSELKVLKR